MTNDPFSRQVHEREIFVEDCLEKKSEEKMKMRT